MIGGASLSFSSGAGGAGGAGAGGAGGGAGGYVSSGLFGSATGGDSVAGAGSPLHSHFGILHVDAQGAAVAGTRISPFIDCGSKVGELNANKTAARTELNKDLLKTYTNPSQYLTAIRKYSWIPIELHDCIGKLITYLHNLERYALANGGEGQKGRSQSFQRCHYQTLEASTMVDNMVVKPYWNEAAYFLTGDQNIKNKLRRPATMGDVVFIGDFHTGDGETITYNTKATPADDVIGAHIVPCKYIALFIKFMKMHAEDVDKTCADIFETLDQCCTVLPTSRAVNGNDSFLVRDKNLSSYFLIYASIYDVAIRDVEAFKRCICQFMDDMIAQSAITEIGLFDAIFGLVRTLDANEEEESVAAASSSASGPSGGGGGGLWGRGGASSALALASIDKVVYNGRNIANIIAYLKQKTTTGMSGEVDATYLEALFEELLDEAKGPLLKLVHELHKQLLGRPAPGSASSASKPFEVTLGSNTTPYNQLLVEIKPPNAPHPRNGYVTVSKKTVDRARAMGITLSKTEAKQLEAFNRVDFLLWVQAIPKTTRFVGIDQVNEIKRKQKVNISKFMRKLDTTRNLTIEDLDLAAEIAVSGGEAGAMFRAGRVAAAAASSRTMVEGDEPGFNNGSNAEAEQEPKKKFTPEQMDKIKQLKARIMSNLKESMRVVSSPVGSLESNGETLSMNSKRKRENENKNMKPDFYSESNIELLLTLTHQWLFACVLKQMANRGDNSVMNIEEQQAYIAVSGAIDNSVTNSFTLNGITYPKNLYPQKSFDYSDYVFISGQLRYVSDFRTLRGRIFIRVDRYTKYNQTSHISKMCLVEACLLMMIEENRITESIPDY